MIQPQRAPVRPRVYPPDGGDAVPLEFEVLELLGAGARGKVAVVGGPGAGKTTALAHLAAVLPADAEVRVCDTPAEADEVVAKNAITKLLVHGVAAPDIGPPERNRYLAVYRLAPWGEDEAIEYLLSAHREQCGSVIERLRTSGDLAFASGNPRLSRIVLDEMAVNDALRTCRDALSAYLNELLTEPESRQVVMRVCLIWESASERIEQVLFEPLIKRGLHSQLRLILHPEVRQLLAAEKLVAELKRDAARVYFCRQLPRELVRDVGELVANDDDALLRLRAMLLGSRAHLQPMAASILHAAGQFNLPESQAPARLAGAYLDYAELRGRTLALTDLSGADLSHADLAEANLTQAGAQWTVFSQASLRGAWLQDIRAHSANFTGADLTGVHAMDGHFIHARFDGADLSGSTLRNTGLDDASFVGARLVGADLRGSRLVDAKIQGADFTDADLAGARLCFLRLADACFEGARFTGAYLYKCDLEGMVLPEANFDKADLDCAYLTGTRMPGASFVNARLVGAALAEIDWEGADLREANLSNATFHMGTTRSGLVGSPLVSEGSRTGFYTDDYHDQDFKHPEEIRKANLRGADLRGADLSNVDFYLVDLRDARFDPGRLDHLKRCGAIL